MTSLPDTDVARSPPTGLIGASRGLREVVDGVRRILGVPVDVLILGESGTGKELVARLIHDADPARSRHAFVAVNCAALPESLLEADLFGSCRGAFTGANADRPGLFQRAHGGTLFLDEIGELPPALQPKLLRALQERAVRPVGAVAERPVDVRVVSATHRDLGQALARGEFRHDLYFRLADYVLDVPPLRDRRGDIPELARHFLRQYRHQFRRQHIADLSPGAIAWLTRCDWRANNVRELSVVLKRAVLHCDGPVLTAGHLEAVSARAEGGPPTGGPPTPAVTPADERCRLEEALHRAGGNLSAAARLLGMKRSTLFDRLRRHGIRRAAAPGAAPR
ncbi:MAG: Sigma-54 factor interaction protein [Candidatus Rokubacteria bacterium]|nr:Sigma-54 factor interaction protein [Candidatus Rokubacteria bacterium]